MSQEVPAWFADALGQSYDSGDVEVDGARIVYRAWGKSGDPVAVLVHGGAAHAGWWDHVAPHLAAGHRVIAIDLSGHGDSGHRQAYSLETWADEVMAVAAAESDLPPVLLGHSMGGFVVLTAAQRHGDAIRGAAAIDSPVREMSPEARAWVAKEHVPGNWVYPDRDTILGRFRTLPADDASLPYVRRHLAEGSIREADGGWTWKFDPRIFLRAQMEPEDLAAATCEIALIRGERGMATTDITDVVAQRLGRNVPVTVIRDAGHHIMLDQPIALIAVLQTLLGQWRNP
ncbi:alpha/beta fold hydrolase [Aeromicrobium sp. 9AM]|uniref:alpha/beta fold hydrolase n=1 Tax=Aeromicrobium sp. 9AM TaxID=2653126 RepID=UPI0012F31F51|nr:alpha/beta hydrolase [Aeromicrobium sp. 9AM]VXC47145.1 Alpha/beta hydrolase [Aeromicrobium sp. 9AM]